jgi:hypothetical protein
LFGLAQGYADYEAALRRAGDQTGVTGEELRATISALIEPTARSREELLGLAVDAERAGEPLAEYAANIDDLADVTGISLPEANALATRTVQQFGVASDEAAGFLFNLNRQGVDLVELGPDLAELQGLAVGAGVGMQDLGAVIGVVVEQLGEARGATALPELFEQLIDTESQLNAALQDGLGQTWPQLQAQGVGLAEALTATDAALAEQGTNLAAYGQEIGGPTLELFVALTGNSDELTAAFERQADGVSGLADATAEYGESAAAGFDDASAAWGAVIDQLETGLGPQLQELGVTIGELVPVILQFTEVGIGALVAGLGHVSDQLETVRDGFDLFRTGFDVITAPADFAADLVRGGDEVARMSGEELAESYLGGFDSQLQAAQADGFVPVTVNAEAAPGEITVPPSFSQEIIDAAQADLDEIGAVLEFEPTVEFTDAEPLNAEALVQNLVEQAENAANRAANIVALRQAGARDLVTSLLTSGASPEQIDAELARLVENLDLALELEARLDTEVDPIREDLDAIVSELDPEVEVVLEANDQTSAVIAGARTAVERFDQLDATADLAALDAASSTVLNAAENVRAFDGQTATATVNVDVSGEADIRRIRAELEALSTLPDRIDIGALVDLTAVSRRAGIILKDGGITAEPLAGSGAGILTRATVATLPGGMTRVAGEAGDEVVIPLTRGADLAAYWLRRSGVLDIAAPALARDTPAGSGSGGDREARRAARTSARQARRAERHLRDIRDTVDRASTRSADRIAKAVRRTAGSPTTRGRAFR